MNPDKLLTSFEGKDRKRSHSKVELEVEVDKTKQHDYDVPIRNKKTKEQQTIKNILDFPDEVLLCIFKNVTPNDLNNLRLCCTNFARLAADKFLWILDYRKETILPSQMKPYKTFLKPLTYSLAIRGDFKHGNRNILSPYFFFKLRQICRILRTLIIEQYYILITKDTLETSTTLENLEFKNCIVAGGTFGDVKLFSPPFFPGICRFVPYIKHLIFNNVLWDLQSTFLTSICTLTELQKLEPLLAENRVEEIIACRDNLFPNYLLSNISRYISRCTNLKILHIRHYSHVTRTDINIMALTLPNLVELDITGCTVTLEDIKHFKSQRPNVNTYSSFSTQHKRYVPKSK
ncbi:uncharacterized protein LOC109862211 isoform X2 [Pseudomyrmex gracilis]|uniref:uncharacterized protein LOC109862211 isoform X2 n=1 Tax=Pseudomyrmex gracilis TaxID=219809 RepID=UPI000994D2DD|nr:uncharacterized protein LOC109862211 isoform X2 [Pseudomyrmex gracilis]